MCVSSTYFSFYASFPLSSSSVFSFVEFFDSNINVRFSRLYSILRIIHSITAKRYGSTYTWNDGIPRKLKGARQRTRFCDTLLLLVDLPRVSLTIDDFLSRIVLSTQLTRHDRSVDIKQQRRYDRYYYLRTSSGPDRTGLNDSNYRIANVCALGVRKDWTNTML